jgi:hypothetical protein
MCLLHSLQIATDKTSGVGALSILVWLGAPRKELLYRFRRGQPVPEGCPLHMALAGGLSAQADLLK